MARSFDQLPLVTATMAKRMDTVANKLVRAASTAAGARAVETTRVDTGKARSNWRANLNSPAFGTIPPYSPGNKLGFDERANASAAKAQQRSVIRTFTVRRHSAVHITNNVDYIGILNNGGPFVGPGQMAQQAVQAAEVAIKSERILKTLIPKGGTGTLTR
jgi:hypothetical protein